MEPDRAALKNEHLTPVEMSKHRQLTGSLNWLVRGSRPDLAFTMIEASTKFKKATVGDLLKVAKVVRKAKSEKSEVIIPNLGDPRNWTLETHTDAALGNLNDGIDSTGAHIIFVSNKKGKMAALDLKSSKIKRVVRSSLAWQL